MAEQDDEPPDFHPKRLANKLAKCPKHPKKEWRELVQDAWDAGWWCEWRTKYIRCCPPDRSLEAVSLPTTSSSHRSLINSRKKMERSGLPKR